MGVWDPFIALSTGVSSRGAWDTLYTGPDDREAWVVLKGWRGAALAWALGGLLLGCLRKASSEPPQTASVAAPELASQPLEPPPIEVPNGPERPNEASPRRVEQPWMSLAEWRRRHEKQLRAPHRSRARLVMLGDSITEAWCESAAFRQALGQHEPLNLGIGGDQTQHVLWRIDHGALDGVAPRAVVILIGVNNLGNGFSPDDTLLGIRAVLDRVAQKLPATSVLLLAVLPAGEKPAAELRAKIAATNPLLQSLEVPGKVRVADVGAVFLEPDGSIAKAHMADFLHPTALGHERLTAAVRPLLDELMRASE